MLAAAQIILCLSPGRCTVMSTLHCVCMCWCFVSYLTWDVFLAVGAMRTRTQEHNLTSLCVCMSAFVCLWMDAFE